MIDRSERSGVAVLRMAHGKANAMDVEFLRALTRTLADLEREEPRAVVVTGTGRIFCAGLDLIRLANGGPAYVREMIPALSECLLSWFAFPRPMVAAINGHAIAGGCLLAWTADRRLMARGLGRIGVPELKVGVPFPWIALEIGRFAVAPAMAQETLLTGETYTVDDAFARGMIDERVDEERLLERALEVASGLAAIAPTSFARTKSMYREPLVRAWKERGRDTDQRTIELWSSDEVLGAVRRYAEKTLKK